MKTHRVGTVTLGGILIVFGILLLLCQIFPTLNYGLILRLWPVVLIALGVEVLLANKRSSKVEFIYDKGAVVLLLLMSIFTVFMAWVDYGIRYHHFTIY